MRYLFIIILSVIFFRADGQGCCSGGSGSPIAGGVSQGVLADKQIELAANHQYFSSDKFKAGSKDTARLFDVLKSNYLYLRCAYGISKELTLSIEAGYYFNKTQKGPQPGERIQSSGIADLLIFPRYDIFNRTRGNKRTELTVGLGYKIPLGKYDDSTVVFVNQSSGEKYYTTSPPSIQPTNGSHDFVFYGFFFREYLSQKLRVFANCVYVKKGWNPLGEKFGDYASVGLFASHTFFKKIGITAQLKGERIGTMQAARNVDLLAMYNVDINSTGVKKLLFVPQLSYNYKKFTIFVLTEIPLYQYVNGVQIASQYAVTSGISYRFLTRKCEPEETK